MSPTNDPVIVGILALLSSGGAKLIYDASKQWRTAPSRAVRSQGIVDANIATVARARDELEEDNARLRMILGEERKQRAEVERLHTEERARWLADQRRLRADVNRLEMRLRSEQAEAAARYDALLEQVHQLRLRANTQEGA
jgi:hypothetical protein